jgi:hypothetical protein
MPVMSHSAVIAMFSSRAFCSERISSRKAVYVAMQMSIVPMSHELGITSFGMKKGMTA